MTTTILTVTNLKGGSGKTTTAAFVAHALHERGLAVLAVDADPQGSLFTWHEAAAFPFPCVAMPSGRLHREVPGIVEGRYDVAVIDTPPTEHGRTISLSALKACTHALIPVAATAIEFQRLADVRTLIEEATEQRPHEVPPDHGVLTVRGDARTSALAGYRTAMAHDGWRVLRSIAPHLQAYAQSFGEPVTRAMSSGYGDAVSELLGLDTPAGVPA